MGLSWWHKITLQRNVACGPHFILFFYCVVKAASSFFRWLSSSLRSNSISVIIRAKLFLPFKIKKIHWSSRVKNLKMSAVYRRVARYGRMKPIVCIWGRLLLPSVSRRLFFSFLLRDFMDAGNQLNSLIIFLFLSLASFGPFVSLICKGFLLLFPLHSVAICTTDMLIESKRMHLPFFFIPE